MTKRRIPLETYQTMSGKYFSIRTTGGHIGSCFFELSNNTILEVSVADKNATFLVKDSDDEYQALCTISLRADNIDELELSLNSYDLKSIDMGDELAKVINSLYSIQEIIFKIAIDK